MSLRLHFDRGDFARAAADFGEAIRLAPQTALYHANRGRSHGRLRAYDKALSDLDEAVRLDPNYVHSYCVRASVHFARKAYGAAIADFIQALALKMRIEQDKKDGAPEK